MIEELAKELFGEMKDFTKEENEKLYDVYEKIYKPIGININDIIGGEREA